MPTSHVLFLQPQTQPLITVPSPRLGKNWDLATWHFGGTSPVLSLCPLFTGLLLTSLVVACSKLRHTLGQTS